MPASSTTFLLLGSVLVYGLYLYIQGLRSNIAAARRTGLPYAVARKPNNYYLYLIISQAAEHSLTSFSAAISPYNALWQVTSKIWTPIIRLLPAAWWEPWLE